MPKFGCFGPRSINFLIFQRNFTCIRFRIYWFQFWHWFSNVLSQNLQIWAFCVKKYQLSNLNEILHVLDFEGADFKSDICFRKFRAQIPNFEHFGTKSINFLILTKFSLCTISKVLISNLTFALCSSYQSNTKVTRINSMPLFCNLLGIRFFVFIAKVSKYYGLNFNFFESNYCKYDIKKI